MKTTCARICVLVILLASPHAARGQGKKRANEPPFSVLERLARQTLLNGEWKKADWKDPGFENEFAKLTLDVGKLTKIDVEKLKLPTTLSKVKFIPEKDKQGARRHGLESELIIAQDVEFGPARYSIIVADGNVRIGLAQRCIIYARGAIEIAHGYGNIVIAGHYVHCSHDGNRGPDDRFAGKDPRRSFLFSGHCLDVAHARDTILHARNYLEVSHANDVVFVNSPTIRVSHKKNCTQVDDAKLNLFPPYINPLADKDIVVLKGVPRNDAGKPGQATLNVGKRQYVVTEGEEVGQAEGAPVAGMAGWKLSYVSQNYALFTKGKADAGFWIGGR